MNLRRKVTAAYILIGLGALIAKIALSGFVVSELGTTAIIIAGTIIPAVALMDFIVIRPLDRLTAVLESLSQGEFDVDIPEQVLHRDDEIGQLASSFDRLLTSFELAILRDSESAQTDKEDLWERAQQAQQALDRAPIGIIVTDPSQEDNPIIYVNDGFQRLTGYDEDEILGRNCRFLQGDDTDEDAVRELRAAIDQRRSTTVELRNYHKSGEPFWNLVTIKPVYDTDDELLYFLGFQQDITRFKEERGADD